MFRKNSFVGKNFWGTGGGYYLFPSKIVFLKVPKNLFLQKILVSQFIMHRSGEAAMSSRNFFVPHDRKTSCWVPSVFQKVYHMEKSLRETKEGYQAILLKMFLSQSAEKMWRNPSMFQKISNVGKNFWRSSAGYYLFPSKFLCLTVPKKSVSQKKLWYRNLSCIRAGRQQ